MNDEQMYKFQVGCAIFILSFVVAVSIIWVVQDRQAEAGTDTFANSERLFATEDFKNFREQYEAKYGRASGIKQIYQNQLILDHMTVRAHWEGMK